MAWVVYTSVLLDIHLDDPIFGNRFRQCLARYLANGLVPLRPSFPDSSIHCSGLGRGDASKAADKLGWQPKYKIDDVVRMMVQAATEAGSK